MEECSFGDFDQARFLARVVVPISHDLMNRPYDRPPEEEDRRESDALSVRDRRGQRAPKRAEGWPRMTGGKAARTRGAGDSRTRGDPGQTQSRSRQIYLGRTAAAGWRRTRSAWANSWWCGTWPLRSDLYLRPSVSALRAFVAPLGRTVKLLTAECTSRPSGEPSRRTTAEPYARTSTPA